MPRGKAKKADNGKPTKWGAVQEALAELGNDAMPVQIQSHIKEKHGLVLDKNLISNYKSNLLKGSGKKKGGRKRKGHGAAAPAKRLSAAGGIAFEDILAVKQLVDRLGVDRVRELAQVLGK